tara:strand:+ start:423 stop:578 length:156 start_codon:yes stop_codon:yes gene_type:complete
MVAFLVPVGILIGKAVIAKSLVGLAGVAGVKVGVAGHLGAHGLAKLITWIV